MARDLRSQGCSVSRSESREAGWFQEIAMDGLSQVCRAVAVCEPDALKQRQRFFQTSGRNVRHHVFNEACPLEELGNSGKWEWGQRVKGKGEREKKKRSDRWTFSLFPSSPIPLFSCSPVRLDPLTP